jgi:hypothetical protein
LSRISRKRQRDGVHIVEACPAPDEVTVEISELLAGYSLNALSDDETAFIDQHLSSRPLWQWELASYTRVSGLLAYTAESRQVPVRARANILARIDALAIESQEAARAKAISPGRFRPRLRRMRRHVPRVAWAAAVPATIVAVIFVMASIVMQDRISEQQSELAAFQQEQVKVNDLLLADSSGQQVVDLVQSNVAPLARGRLFIDMHDNTAMLVVRDMPLPVDDRVYIVWMIIGTDFDEYAQLGELTVDSLGRGQKILEPPDGFTHYPVVRITVEQSVDVGIPSGPDVMTGGIARTTSD